MGPVTSFQEFLKGQILAQQQAVVEALEIRFDRVPDGLCEEIGHIVDSTSLHVLLRAAIRCADLESSRISERRVIVAIRNLRPRGRRSATCRTLLNRFDDLIAHELSEIFDPESARRRFPAPE